MTYDIYDIYDIQLYIYMCVCVYYIYIYIYIYGIHFDLRFFDSIQKVGPSGIRTNDLVVTVYTLLTTELSGRTIRCA